MRTAPTAHHTPRLVAIGAASTALLVAVPCAPARAVTPAHRLTLNADPAAIDVRPDGSIRVVTSRRTGSKLTLIASTLRRDGSLRPGKAFASSPHTSLRSSATAFTDLGPVAAFGRPAAPGRKRSVDVVAGDTGGRSTRQRVSDPAVSANDPELRTGGGAVGVLFTQRPPKGRAQLMWAYRPAHAKAFRRAQMLTDRPQSHDFRYVVELGPRGDGAVLETTILPEGGTPPFRVRRLAADGSVGPWITVSDEGFEDGAGELAVGPDGTIGIAFWADRAIAGQRETALVATTLAPGATRVTPPQYLDSVKRDGDDQSALPDYDFGFAIGPRGQAAIATIPDDDRKHIKLFSGPAHALALTGDFSAPGIDPAHTVTVTRDGGVTAVWAPNDSFVAPPIVATHKPLGGRFSLPSVVARSRSKGESELQPIFLSPARDGSALLGYRDEDFRDEVSRVVTLLP